MNLNFWKILQYIVYILIVISVVLTPVGFSYVALEYFKKSIQQGVINAFIAIYAAFIGMYGAHYFTVKRDQKNEKARLKALCHTIYLVLGKQESALANFEIDLARRLTCLQEEFPLGYRERCITIVQDFDIYELTIPNLLSSLGGLLTLADAKAYSDLVSAIDQVFEANRLYLNFLGSLKRFHEAKRGWDSSTSEEEWRTDLLRSCKTNFPAYQTELESIRPLISDAREGFKKAIQSVDVNIIVFMEPEATQLLANPKIVAEPA